MTCCYGWGNIDWTKDEVEKLKCAECSEELKSLIEKTFVENGSKYNVKYNEKGFCPLLDENGLCRVQKELGVEYMSKTCIIYPRHSIISGNTAINYCNISCYHIMDTLCRQKDSMAIENLLPKSAKVKEMATDIDGANDVLKSPELKFRNQLFDLFYDIISDESYSLETALTLGALAANNLDKIVRSGETNAPRPHSRLEGSLEQFCVFLNRLCPVHPYDRTAQRPYPLFHKLFVPGGRKVKKALLLLIQISARQYSVPEFFKGTASHPLQPNFSGNIHKYGVFKKGSNILSIIPCYGSKNEVLMRLYPA